MPAKKWPPPIQHHKPSGRARVRIAGRDVYLGPYGSEEAARNYAELLTRLASGGDVTAPPPPTPTGTTVAAVVARWLAEESPRYSAEGREAEQFRLALRPLVRLFGTLPARDFDCDRLEQLQLAMATGTWQSPEEAAKARKKGFPLDWSCRVVNRRIVRVRTVWRWAERKKLVPAGSFAHLCTLPCLSPTDARVRHCQRQPAATVQDVGRVCKRLPPVGRAMLLTQWFTGMRSGELRAMRADEVDRSGEVWIYRPRTHKMQRKGQTRAIAIGSRAQKVLRQWLDKAGTDGYVFPPSRHRSDGSRDHYSSYGYAQLIRRAAEAAGLPGWHAYLARHGFKMHLTRTLGIESARAVLGHRSASTTHGYGDSVDLQTATAAARKLG